MQYKNHIIQGQQVPICPSEDKSSVEEKNENLTKVEKCSDITTCIHSYLYLLILITHKDYCIIRTDIKF